MSMSRAMAVVIFGWSCACAARPRAAAPAGPLSAVVSAAASASMSGPDTGLGRNDGHAAAAGLEARIARRMPDLAAELGRDRLGGLLLRRRRGRGPSRRRSSVSHLAKRDHLRRGRSVESFQLLRTPRHRGRLGDHRLGRGLGRVAPLHRSRPPGRRGRARRSSRSLPVNAVSMLVVSCSRSTSIPDFAVATLA